MTDSFNRRISLFPVFTIIICVLLFLFIAVEVHSGNTIIFDKSILIALRDKNNLSVPVGAGWLLPFMRIITVLGNFITIIIVTAMMVVILPVKKEINFLWIVLLAVIGGSLLDFCLKDLFARTRPEIVPHLVKAYWYSFPSGHSVMSAVVYPALAVVIIRVTGKKKLNYYIASAVLIIVLLVGFSRVYLGVHYPTDVIAGWAAGAAWSAVCWLISGRIKKQINDKVKNA